MGSTMNCIGAGSGSNSMLNPWMLGWCAGDVESAVRRSDCGGNVSGMVSGIISPAQELCLCIEHGVNDSVVADVDSPQYFPPEAEQRGLGVIPEFCSEHSDLEHGLTRGVAHSMLILQR